MDGMEIKFTISGQPVGKGRPRFTRTGHAYTPQKTRDYEALVSTVAKQCTKDMSIPMDAPCEILINAFFKIPKSWSRKKVAEALQGKIRPTVKPDWDNIAKTTDALNGILFNDDKQCVDGTVKKFYALDPRVEITVKYLDIENG